MYDFYVGQKVVCINDLNYPGRTWKGDCPKKDSIYTITDIKSNTLPGPNRDPMVLMFKEIKNSIPKLNKEDVGYNACRFKPLEEKTYDIEWAREIARNPYKSIKKSKKEPSYV